MSKMKRIFSLVLVFAMVLGSFGTVFAATDVATEDLKKVPTDVVGTEYEKAVSRLVAFDVLNGYKDGTYKPEQDVTRAEFAKILVEALGIGNAAKAAQGKVTFPDVTASHWASGYINVASGQGLIEGFPSGEFKPNDQVTYAEALTMLVRALGYQDSFLKGQWPGSHIAKAAEAGITSGVSYSDARGFANRGKVAQMVNNTLDADVVKVDTYKDGTVEYTESDVTLLKDKLDVSKYEDARVIADKIVNDSLNEDEITVKFLKEIKKDNQAVKNSYDENEERDFEVSNNVNARKNIGEEVSVYMNNNEEVVYIETENDDKANFDYVEEAKGNSDEVTELSLVKFDKDYDFDEDAKVYVYNAKDDQYKDITVDRDGARVDVESVLGHVGKFVVKNNKIVYAEVMESSEALPWMLVLDNNDGLLEGINQTTEDFDIDLSEDGNYDGVFAFDTMGNSIEVEDIEAGNIVYIEVLDYDGDDYVKVVAVQDNMVEGELSRVKDDRVTIDGKQIKAVRYDNGSKQYQAYYSIDGFEIIEEWNSAEYDDDMKDADEENMVAYLDATGRIAFLSTEATATSGFQYGVVTRTYTDNDKIKIYTHVDEKDGEEITYRVEEEKDLAEPFELDEYGNEKSSRRATEIKKGEVIKFKLNKDGEIAEDEFFVMDKANTWVMKKDTDFGKSSLSSSFKTVNSGTDDSFAIDNRAVIVDAQGLDASALTINDVDDFGIAKWEDMAEDNYNSSLEYFVFTKRNNDVDIDALVFVGSEGANTASDEEAIYVIDKWSKGGDDYVKYISYEDKKVEEKEVNDGYEGKERPYIAKMKSDGKIDLYITEKGDLDFVSGKVTKKANNVITVNNKDYKLPSSALVYEEDTKKSTSNIRVNDEVFFIVENNVNIRVIERVAGGVAGGSTTVATDGTVTYTDASANEIQLDNGTVLEVVANAKAQLAQLENVSADKLEVKLTTNSAGNVTVIDNVVATVSTDGQFDSVTAASVLTGTETGIENLKAVNVTADLTNPSSKRIVDINLNDNKVTGTLDVDSLEEKSMTINGTSTINNLTIDAANADVVNNVEVTGTITVDGIAQNTFTQNAKANNIAWNVAGKATLKINAEVKNVVVAVGSEAAIKGANNIATNLKVNGKADLDVAVADEKLAAGTKENISVGGEATDEAALSQAKTDAITALEEYVDAADYTINANALTTAIAEGKAAINAADTEAKITTALNSAKTVIDAIKSDVQENAIALSQAKIAKKATVDAVLEGKVEANYTAASWAAVKQAQIVDKALIDAKETVAEVTEYNLTAKEATLVLDEVAVTVNTTAVATDATGSVTTTAKYSTTSAEAAKSGTEYSAPVDVQIGTTIYVYVTQVDSASEAVTYEAATSYEAVNADKDAGKTVTISAGDYSAIQ